MSTHSSNQGRPLGTPERLAPVRFDAPPEAVFDLFVDPRQRPRWQSSLRSVLMRDEDAYVGQTWTDVTVVGVRPVMTTTELKRPTRWTEVGRWAGISAWLTLEFTPDGDGTLVAAEFLVTGRGLWRVPAAVVQRIAPPAIRADITRAARSFDG